MRKTMTKSDEEPAELVLVSVSRFVCTRTTPLFNPADLELNHLMQPS